MFVCFWASKNVVSWWTSIFCVWVVVASNSFGHGCSWEGSEVKLSPRKVDLPSIFWHLRPHYPNPTFCRSYGRSFIDSVIPIPSFTCMFFSLWGCWKSQNPLTWSFFCGKTLGYESVTLGAHFESVFWLHFGGFEWKFGLAMWSLKPDIFHMRIEWGHHSRTCAIMLPATVLGRCEDVDSVELEKPGEVPAELIEDQKPAPVELFNDLKAAIEVNSSNGRRVLYPRRRMKFDGMPLEVGLRDDPSIRSICKEFAGTQLCMSSGAFGNFCTEAQTFIQKEDASVQREKRLERQRIRELRNKAKWAVFGPFFKWNSCLWGVVLVLLVVCLVVPLESYAVALVLCLGAGCLCCCTCQISFFSAEFFGAKQDGAKRVAKDLQQDVDDMQDLEFALQQDVDDVLSEGQEGFLFLFPPCLGCVLAFVCLVVMTVMYAIQAFPWAATLLWLPVLLLLAFFIAVFKSEKILKAYRAVFERIFGDTDELEKEGGLNLTDRTIVFEGKILPGKPCVSSWPGKYESAWDALVQKSRGGHLSAAVVFLPEGSRHFGKHDQIPPAEDLPGACWCTPLYGEEKPWGCRWWTHWIKNIEEAVEKGAKLEVYFFHNMKGKGKVENFATAGAEHLRRERIFRRKGEFRKSQEFQSAVSAGLGELSRKKCGDGSSQYSREDHRLFSFMAWWGGSGIPGFLRRLRQLTESGGCMAAKKGLFIYGGRGWHFKVGGKWVKVWDCFTMFHQLLERTDLEGASWNQESPQLERC